VLRILLSALFSGSLHFYVWWRLVHRSHLPRPATIGLSSLMVLMWLSIPITITSRMWAPELGSTLGWVSLTWLALVGVLFVTCAAFDVPRQLVRLVRRVMQGRQPALTPEGMSRRLFLSRVGAGTAVTVASTGIANGMVTARGVHEVVDVEIKLAKLPKALDGFSIVQLSDLHVGLTIDRHFVQKVVDITNGLQPDLIAFTGDFVDGKVADLRDEIAPLGELRAKHGVYAITGNHEYYAGADPWIAEISRLGARYLRNELVTIGEPGAAFDLAGVDDHGAHGYVGHGEDLAKATSARNPGHALVLLAHQPRQVRRSSKYGVDLQLSGHTHGGQIWPWHYIVKVQQGGLLAGRYQHGDTQLYVSRGCGYWGPPVRLLAPLEITRVILRCA